MKSQPENETPYPQINKQEAMALTGKKKANNNGSLRENPEVNAKIDTYMKEHPKLVEQLNKLDKDRLIRTVVLTHVKREEGINNSIQNQWKQNPEQKAALQTLVAHLPKEKQEQAMLNMARRAKVEENKAKYSQQQGPASKGVKA